MQDFGHGQACYAVIDVADVILDSSQPVGFVTDDFGLVV